MDKQTKANQKQPQGLQINNHTFIGSTYSQAVSVTVTDLDLTLEFAYVNPKEKTQGAVVSRVTLPRAMGESLSKLITDTVKKHENNKREKKNVK